MPLHTSIIFQETVILCICNCVLSSFLCINVSIYMIPVCISWSVECLNTWGLAISKSEAIWKPHCFAHVLTRANPRELLPECFQCSYVVEQEPPMFPFQLCVPVSLSNTSDLGFLPHLLVFCPQCPFFFCLGHPFSLAGSESRMSHLTAISCSTFNRSLFPCSPSFTRSVLPPPKA